MSSIDVAIERGCPVSGSLTWILCGNQDLLLKYGTARERRKERQEQTNGESDRTTRRETETGREEDGERRRLVAPCPSSVSRSSRCSRCASTRCLSRDRSRSRSRSRSRAPLARQGWSVWGRPGQDPFVLRTAVGSFVLFAGNLWLSRIYRSSCDRSIAGHYEGCMYID